MSLYAPIAVGLSILVGSVTALQFGLGLTKFGGLEYVGRVTALSGLRVLGSASSASAALFALVMWTHPFDADGVRTRLLRASPWVLLMIALATPATMALVVFSGFLTARWGLAVPWETIAAGRRAVDVSDIPAAAETLLFGIALVGAFCWFALPAMGRRR